MTKSVKLSTLFFCLLTCSPFVMGATERTLDAALHLAIDEVCPTQEAVPTGLGSNLTEFCENRKLFASGIPSEPAGAGGSSTSHQQNRQLLPDNRDANIAEIERGPWTLFATAKIEQIDKALTNFEPAFDSEGSGVTIGIDYQLQPELNIGLAVVRNEQNGDFAQNGGQFDVVDINFLIFGFYRYGKGSFIDTALSFTRRDTETTRRFLFEDTTGNNALLNTDTLVSSGNNADTLFVSVRGGHDWLLNNGVTLGLSSALQYEQLNIDGFTETGDTALALTYLSQEEERLTGELSLFGSMTRSRSWGVIAPQFTISYQHEFSDDQRDISAFLAEDQRAESTIFRFSNDPPDRNYFRLNVGASVNFQDGFAVFIDYSEQFGYDDYDRNAISLGVRKEL